MQVGRLPLTSAMTSLGLVGISRIAWPASALVKGPAFSCQDAKARGGQANHEGIFLEDFNVINHSANSQRWNFLESN